MYELNIVGSGVTGTVTAWPMMIGAAAAAIVAVLMIETVKRLGKVESGAAMGVVFTTLFATGVLLLEQTDTSAVHLDVEHALYGNLESLVWFDATGWDSLTDAAALSGLPPQLGRLAIVTLGMIGFIALFWQPLVISTFDRVFAQAIGIRVTLVGFALVVATAVAAVAAFDAVGSIIVISMFICPPAAARLMTDRLGRQVAWSIVFAIMSAVLGYVLAGYGPGWFGAPHALSAAGTIAAVSGLILGLACLFGPRRMRSGQGEAA